ncbi:MAG: hypothetical protein M1839_005935 [Geoglossum umbratile]|nr:MAG: hypothetical protein M1839_005935 [Geoglossum umbratile]
MATKLEKRLDYLIDKLKAYEGYDHQGLGLRNAVQTELKWWADAQHNMDVIQVPFLFNDLWNIARKKNQKQYIAKVTRQGWQEFQVLASSNNHLRIEDQSGHLLAYRLRVPTTYTQTLNNTDSLIPIIPFTKHERGNTVNRHWGMWKKYVAEPRMTSEYCRDQPYAQQWLEANEGLFGYLSDVLRLLEPEMYMRYNSILPFLPDGVQPSCGAWHACAINQGMITEGKAHFDYSDYHCGLNAVTGWGDHTTAKLILWQLGLALEVKPGDAVLFLGRVLIHNAVDIQGGARSVVDCFTHEDPLTWTDRKQEELAELGEEEPSTKGKGKGRHKNSGSMGNAKSEDLDEDEESGDMYTLRLGEPEEDSD